MLFNTGTIRESSSNDTTTIRDASTTLSQYWVYLMASKLVASGTIVIDNTQAQGDVQVFVNVDGIWKGGNLQVI